MHAYVKFLRCFTALCFCVSFLRVTIKSLFGTLNTHATVMLGWLIVVLQWVRSHSPTTARRVTTALPALASARRSRARLAPTTRATTWLRRATARPAPPARTASTTACRRPAASATPATTAPAVPSRPRQGMNRCVHGVTGNLQFLCQLSIQVVRD